MQQSYSIRPRKTRRETIQKDLEVNELEKDMVSDRTLQRHLIHVAPTRLSGKRLGCCCNGAIAAI